MLTKNFHILMKLFSYFWREEKHLHFRLILAFACMGIGICLNIGLPLILKYIVSHFENGNFSSFLFVLFFYVVIWTLSQITLVLRDMCVFQVIERSIRRLSLDFIKHLNKLSSCFHVEKKTGDLTNSLEKAKAAIPTIFHDFIFMLFPTVLEIIIAASILWRLYSFLYGAVLLVVVITFITYSLIVSKKISHCRQLSNKYHRNVTNIFVEFLLNFELIRYFGKEDYEVKVLDGALKERENAESKSLLFLQLAHIYHVLILGVGFLILVIMLGMEISVGNKNISDFVFINALVLKFFVPLSGFGSILRRTSKSFSDVSYLFNILEITPEIQDISSAKPLTKQKSCITFKDVKFGYNKNLPLLDRVSFSIPAGKTVAIVGPTGSGKSTITKLLYRFYDVPSGEILINEQNLKNINRASIANLIGIVPQDTLLFNNTIGYNIGYGKLGATQTEIEEAAIASQLDKFINSLPQKYETVVGERGLKLSGGEKQRIALARLVLKNPSIYVFDEATSSLDTKTEEAILDTMINITKNKTAIIISHNLYTVMHADEILFLKDGEIKEGGNHQDLINSNGLYANLWNTQAIEIQKVS